MKALNSVTRSVLAIAAVMIPVLSAPVAQATPMTFGGVLSGSNEVPPTNSPATGSVTVVLDPSAQTLAINTTFSGLTSNDVAAHIHCCAPLGTNAIVATTMPAFTGFPLGVTAGTFGQSFSLTDPTLYSTGFVTAHGGTVAGAEAALIAGIESEMTYFNIHTVNFAGGEIRAQLLSVAVPEPASLVLLGSAGVAFGLIRRRERRTAKR